MNILKTTVFCVFTLGVFACSDQNADGDYFNGKVKYTDDNSIVVSNVKSKVVAAENYGYGMFAVYDSLLVCWNPKFPEHFFRISNVDTGQEIGYFCNKGRGPQDFASTGPILQFFQRGEDIMTLAYASNEGKVFFWNISQSIVQGVSVYDTIVPIDDRIKGIASSSAIFFQNEDRLLAKMRTSISGETGILQPDYQQRTIYSNELLQDYYIYDKERIVRKKSNPYGEELFYSMDVVKPDGSKVAQGMKYLAQINILDIGNGEVIGCRMKDGVGFSIFETEKKEEKVYYNSIQADDDYIYATYWGKKQWDVSLEAKMPLLNTIHVFDWNGNMVRELKTDRAFFRIELDRARNRLYSADFETDELYYLDLNEIMHSK